MKPMPSRIWLEEVIAGKIGFYFDAKAIPPAALAEDSLIGYTNRISAIDKLP